MKCISCGNLIPDASTVCPYCNSAVEPIGANKPVYGDTLAANNTPITPDLPVAQPGGVAVPQGPVIPTDVLTAPGVVTPGAPVTPEVVAPVTPEVVAPVAPDANPVTPVMPVTETMPQAPVQPEVQMQAVAPQPVMPTQPVMGPNIGVQTPVVPGMPTEPVMVNQADVPVEAAAPTIPEAPVEPVVAPPVSNPSDPSIIVPTPAPTTSMVSQGIEPTAFGGEKVGSTAPEAKKKMSKGALIAIIVLVLIVVTAVVLGVLYYNSQYKSANDRLDAVVNGMFKSLLEVRNEELEVASGEYSIKASQKSNDQTISGSLSGKYASDTIRGISDLTVNIDSLYFGEELLDAGELNFEVYAENNRVYFLLQNFYEKYIYVDTEETEDTKKDEEEEVVLDYQITVKAIREATKRALRATTKEQTVKDVMIAGATQNANVVTIELNEANGKKMLNAFVNALANNPDFIKEVSAVFGISEEEAKNELLSIIEEKETTTEETDEDSDYSQLFVEPKKETEKYVLEIYTAKFGEEFLGANLSVKVVYDKKDEHYSEMYQDVNAMIEIYEKEEALHIDLTSDEKKIFEFTYSSVSEMNSDTEETLTNLSLTYRDASNQATTIALELKVIADLQPKVDKVVVKNIINANSIPQSDIDSIYDKITKYGTLGVFIKNYFDEQIQNNENQYGDITYGDDEWDTGFNEDEDSLLDSGNAELDLNTGTL